MRRQYSVYLDLVRFMSAMIVFCSHMTEPVFTGGAIPYQGTWAGLGVLTFFVLSGYVISFVASTKETTLRSFSISRLARIYSVALPAIVLTIIVDLVSMKYGWLRTLPDYQYASFPKYLASALTFTNQSAFLSETTFGNAAFWSLDYEVWYYMIFAAFVYYSGWKRAVLLPLLLLLSGPAVLLYLPLWLVGVGIFHVHQRFSISRQMAILLFVISLTSIVGLRLTGFDEGLDINAKAALGGWAERHLHNSQNFASHYLMAGFVGVNLFAANYLPLRPLANEVVAKAVVYCASFTFALYLMHRPLLDVFARLWHHDPSSPLSFVLLGASVLTTVWLLGFVTEHRKKQWRRLFANLLDNLNVWLIAHAPALKALVAPNATTI